MDAGAIAAILKHYRVEASPALCRSVAAYLELLLKWNRKVNLTAVTDPAEIIGRHFGESLFALSAISIRPRSLADVGSGAGFPGLALKLLLPEMRITLIEANIKKAAFLSEVARHLQLENVSVLRDRMEAVDVPRPLADCVTARAVGGFDELLSWSARALEPGGTILLWLGAVDAGRIMEAARWTWSQPIAIPRSERRVLLAGSPAA
jgi:16S rRNA (guanine527-N7)-methyltransferase